MTRVEAVPSPSAHGLLPHDLRGVFADAGVPCSAGPAAAGVDGGHGRDDLDAMPRPVRRPLREAARALLDTTLPTVVERVVDPVDGSCRFVFALRDGALVEAVRIPLHKEGAFSVCLSSQVGCAMACDFCATGRLGLQRNLTAAEIVGTWLAVRETAREEGGRVTGAVFMARASPSTPSCRRADPDDDCGADRREPLPSRRSPPPRSVASRRRATVPPRGVAASALPGRRAELLPVAGRLDMDELFDAIWDYHRAMGRRSPWPGCSWAA